MNGKKVGVLAARPNQTIPPPQRKDLDVIIARRGGFGPDANLTPNPRTTHSRPKAETRGVC
jgi:hypothetical protein